jgi:hypothetical protein
MQSTHQQNIQKIKSRRIAFSNRTESVIRSRIQKLRRQLVEVSFKSNNSEEHKRILSELNRENSKLKFIYEKGLINS